MAKKSLTDQFIHEIGRHIDLRKGKERKQYLEGLDHCIIVFRRLLASKKDPFRYKRMVALIEKVEEALE